MRIAFKEWAVVVDALGRGDQILILRKGGIAEGPGGFKAEHPEFWLFPTLFHQQRERVIEPARWRYDEIAPHLPEVGKVRLEFLARVVGVWRLQTLAEAERLRDQHIWRDEVIAGRCDWGREPGLHALAVRVFRLPKPVEWPMRPEYAGCKSWVELEADPPKDGLSPVLGESEFAAKLEWLRSVLPA